MLEQSNPQHASLLDQPVGLYLFPEFNQFLSPSEDDEIIPVDDYPDFSNRVEEDAGRGPSASEP